MITSLLTLIFPKSFNLFAKIIKIYGEIVVNFRYNDFKSIANLSDLHLFEKKQYRNMITFIITISLFYKYIEYFGGSITASYLITLNIVAWVSYYWATTDRVMYIRIFALVYFTGLPLIHSYLPQFENRILALPANTVMWTLYAIIFSGSFKYGIVVYICNTFLMLFRYKDLLLKFLLLLGSNSKLGCSLYVEDNSLCATSYRQDTINDSYEKYSLYVNVYIRYSTQCSFAMLAVMMYFVNSRQQLIKLLINERTQLTEVNVKLRQANEELLKNINSKDEFLLSVSHELRNPLNIIMGNIDLALMKIVNQSVRTYLHTAKLSAEMLLFLISNLLDSGKLQTQNLEVSYVPTKINDFLQRIWATTRVFIQKKHLQGRIYFHKKIPDMINIDPHRVMQIIFNLVGNAVKFTDKGYVSLVISWLDKAQLSDQDYLPTNLNDKILVNTTENPEENLLHLQKHDSIELLHSIGNSSFHSVSFEEIPSMAINCEPRIFRLYSSRKIKQKSLLDTQDAYFVLDYSTECFPNLLNMNNLQAEKSLDMPNVQKIKPETLFSQGFLKIEVCDSGCGISTTEQQSLFQKFSQLGTNNSKRKLGSGLGLWISQTLCKNMGGEIRVSSIPETGSTFIANLSCGICIGNSELMPEKSTFLSSIKIKSTKTSCLVVDNFKTNQDINISFLSRCDVDVPNIAFNGLEAYNLYISKGPNYYELIFMDVEMPVMNGIEAAKKIRRFETLNNWKPTIIIFITGNCKKEHFEELLNPNGDVKANYVFSKPFTFYQCKDLITQIKTHKNKHNQ